MANTHKDNNEIPLRAREVLPENRKDFSNYWNLLFYSHGSLSSGMRRCHRCDFTTFPIRRKPIEILLDQHNRGNCEAREEPHKSYLFLKCLEFSYDRCFNSNIISFTELDHTLNFLNLIHFSNKSKCLLNSGTGDCLLIRSIIICITVCNGSLYLTVRINTTNNVSPQQNP